MIRFREVLHAVETVSLSDAELTDLFRSQAQQGGVVWQANDVAISRLDRLTNLGTTHQRGHTTTGPLGHLTIPYGDHVSPVGEAIATAIANAPLGFGVGGLSSWLIGAGFFGPAFWYGGALLGLYSGLTQYRSLNASHIQEDLLITTNELLSKYLSGQHQPLPAKERRLVEKLRVDCEKAGGVAQDFFIRFMSLLQARQIY